MSGFNFRRELQTNRASDEKRAYPRAENSLRAHVQYAGRAFEGISQDISLSGLRLCLSHELPAQAMLDIRLYMPRNNLTEFRNQQPLVLRGRVMWVRPDGENHLYGVHFESLTDVHRQALREAVRYFNKPAEYN